MWGNREEQLIRVLNGPIISPAAGSESGRKKGLSVCGPQGIHQSVTWKLILGAESDPPKSSFLLHKYQDYVGNRHFPAASATKQPTSM